MVTYAKSASNDNILVLIIKLVFWAAKIPGTKCHKDMMGTLPSKAVISVLVIKLVFLGQQKSLVLPIVKKI
jgi:hypothetical protein